MATGQHATSPLTPSVAAIVASADFAVPKRTLGHLCLGALGKKRFGRLRDKCLNVTQFTSLDDARRKIEAWRQDYNHTRPHSSLRNLTPHEFPQQGQQKWISEGANFSL